jgi:hypothetical protein
MRRTMTAFLFGVVVGGVGVGAIVLTMGDPYDYVMLRPYSCEQVERDPALAWASEMVPDQTNICFRRFPRYPRWLMP